MSSISLSNEIARILRTYCSVRGVKQGWMADKIIREYLAKEGYTAEKFADQFGLPLGD